MDKCITLAMLFVLSMIEIQCLPVSIERFNDGITKGSAVFNEKNSCSVRYVAARGSNHEYCGGTSSTACRTLNALLRKEAKGAKNKDVPRCLRIFTETSLTFDESVQRRNPWIENTTLIITRMGSMRGEKPTVRIQNVRFTGGIWFVRKIPIHVVNSDLSSLELRIHFPKVQATRREVEISQSQLGEIHIAGATSVKIYDSSAFDQDLKHNLLTLVSSTAHISNTDLVQNSGKTLISLEQQSSLKLQNTSFMKNELKLSAVHLNESVLFVQGSSFEMNQGSSNGGCIQAWNQSQIEITSSKFRSNSALVNAGAIYLSNNVRLNISNSEFLNNSADSAGAIVAYTNSHIHILNSDFKDNKGKSYTGTIKAYNNCSITLHRSNFSHNTVEQSVGVLGAGESSTVSITDCTFKNNTSQVKNTGALYLEVNSTLKIVNSYFLENKAAQTGGVIGMYKNCTANIYGSVFSSNSAGDASGCINIVDNCALNISSTEFLNNVASFSGGAITGNVQDHVHITDCNFFNNTAHTGGGGSIANKDGCHLSVTNSTFVANKSGYKGGALYFLSSTGAMSFCNFSGNNAAIYAGAVVLENSNVTFANTFFRQNKAQSEGGAISAKESKVGILRCNFMGNEAIYRSGGALALEHQTLVYVQSSNFADNSAGYTGGVVVANSASEVTFEEVQVESNFAQIGGALSFQPKTKFTAINSDFQGNSASGYAGLLFMSLHSCASLTNCSLVRNTGRAMAGVAYVVRATLKLSNTFFLDNWSPKGKSLYFFGKHGNKVRTHRAKFYIENNTVNSGVLSGFWKKLKEAGEVWVSEFSHLHNVETPYASSTPVNCWNGCTCHNDLNKNVNIFNCSELGLDQLPQIPHKTDWLDLSKNRIQIVGDVFKSYRQAERIDLSGNKIVEFSHNLIHFLNDTNLKHMNLQNNKLTRLPEAMKVLSNLKELLLSGNPFKCHCDMMWMPRWLQKLSLDDTFVLDSKNITCGPGSWHGKPVYEITSEALGCSLHWYWALVFACLAVILFVTVALVLHRNWERLKFLLFVHFDILATDDGTENLEDMQFDAFVSYSREDQIWVITEVLNFLEESHSFRVCIHQRDFSIGTPIICNITDSILHSRKMILVLSRNFISSGWCMEEFRIAHEQVVSGRRKFLIPVLLEDINNLDIPDDLRLYLDTYTYLEVKGSDTLARKKLRYAMPKNPLKDLKLLPPRREYRRIRSSTSQQKRDVAVDGNWTECDRSSDSDTDRDENEAFDANELAPIPKDSISEAGIQTFRNNIST